MADANVQTAPGPWYREINSTQWKALFAAFLGWALDAFDFIMYNFTIITLIKEWGLTTTQTGFVASITMFASAFGGMVFGFFADRYGRLHALTITILIYSVATGFCGMAQNMWQLMAARLVVGLGMGGEWSAGAALVAETWPAKHRGKAMSIMQSGYALGGVIASLVSGHIIALWGWRVLFFLGILPALLAWWVRHKIEEPEIWKKNAAAQAQGGGVKVSWFDLFRGNLLKITLVGSLFCIFGLSAGYPQAVWLAPWLGAPAAKGGAGLSVVQSSMYLMPYYFGSIAGYWAFGFLCDKLGRKPAFAVYFLLAAVFQPLLIFGGTDNLALFLVLITMTGWTGVGFFGGFGIIIGEMYPTKIRASGQGFCYNLARGVAAFSVTGAGAFAQAIGLGNTLIYLSGLFVLAAVALLLIPETKGTEFA